MRDATKGTIALARLASIDSAKMPTLTRKMNVGFDLRGAPALGVAVLKDCDLEGEVEMSCQKMGETGARLIAF